MLLAGFLVDLFVYWNLFQEAHILKIHVPTCFCEIQPVHCRCYQQWPNWTAAGEGKRISSQPDFGLVFPLGNISLCLVDCQLREGVKTDELNHVFPSTGF